MRCQSGPGLPVSAAQSRTPYAGVKGPRLNVAGDAEIPVVSEKQSRGAVERWSLNDGIADNSRVNSLY